MRCVTENDTATCNCHIFLILNVVIIGIDMLSVILTEKLFVVGSSNFGFVHLDNWATHLKLTEVRRLIDVE